MKNVVVWGAASGLGAAMVEYFAAQQWNVTAVARDPSKNPQLAELCQQVLVCDATNKEQVQNTVNQLAKDSLVVSTMGSFQAEVPVDYIGHRYLTDALEAANVQRFLLVTSLGCGDSWQYLSERARKGFGGAVREKSLAETWLQSSGLDFTILRPGGLKNGEVTNNGELSQHVEVHGVITRSEVARLVHQLLDDPKSVGEVYQCIDPNLTY